jgi:hypothetical protein
LLTGAVGSFVIAINVPLEDGGLRVEGGRNKLVGIVVLEIVKIRRVGICLLRPIRRVYE